MLRHTLKPGYAGPFRSLAEEYENGGKTTFTAAIKAVPHASEAASGIICLSDFVSGRWGEAFRSIADQIADGDIRARGVAIDGEERLPSGDMPAASVTNAMLMDHKYTVWEGPQAIGGKQSRRWIGITLEWNGLLKCFPKPRAPTEKEKKRAATIKAIEALGSERLQLLSQKERVAQIIERVHADNDGLSVSDRLVRDCFTEARKLWRLEQQRA